MKTNTTRQKLIAGQPAVGILAHTGSPVAAGYLARGGFDFVVVDNQHGHWDDNTTLDAFHAIVAEGGIPYTRVRKNDFYAIGRMLDRGALGVIVPFVNSVAEAEAAAFAMRFPPDGGRSYGFTLAEYHGVGYGEAINAEVHLAVQIESAEAVTHAVDILSVPGVDGCWIGPVDLAASMGTVKGSAEHTAAVLSVLAACRKTGKIPGIHTYGAVESQRWIDAGFQFVTAGSEANLIFDGCRQALKVFGRG